MQVNSLNQSPLSMIAAEKLGAQPTPTVGGEPEAPVVEGPRTRAVNKLHTHAAPAPSQSPNPTTNALPTIQAAPTNLLADPNAPTVNAGTSAEHAPTERRTLEGLMKAWGTADKNYDLTRDGTVDVQDLLAFVAQQQAADPSDPAQGLTQEGFTKAWGTDNEQYDLTQDGTVDVRDLLAFLETLHPGERVALDPTLAAAANAGPNAVNGAPGQTAGNASGPALGNAGVVGGPGKPTVTIQNLMDTWGTNNARFDVTEDGRVDVSDLLAVLAAVPAAEPEPTPNVANAEPQLAVDAAPNAAVNAAATIEPKAVLENAAGSGVIVPDEEPAGSVDGVLKAWGTADARFDYDDSGIVDVDDLLAAIAARAEQGDAADPARPEHGVNALNHRGNGIRGIVEDIFARLNSAGFEQRPPVNLHELLGQAGIEGEARGAVLSGLAQQYPNGLGVNFRA